MKQSYYTAFLAILFISACKPATENTTGESTESQPQEPTTSCYLFTFGKDTTALQLTLSPDNSATGFMAWEPFEKDGGRGFFEGKKEGETIEGDFTYMIEGFIQTEEVVFKSAEGGIAKGRGALTEQGERLIISDKASLNFDDIFKPVICSDLNGALSRAKSVSEFIKEERAKRYETLTGTYAYDFGEESGTGELKVKQLENGRAQISFLIVGPKPTFNQGFGEGVLALDENLEGDFVTDEFGAACKIRFSFKGNKVVTKQLVGDSPDCGFGNNVRMNKEFTKQNAADPFSEPSS